MNSAKNSFAFASAIHLKILKSLKRPFSILLAALWLIPQEGHKNHIIKLEFGIRWRSLEIFH